MRIYQFANNGVYTGVSRDITDQDVIPKDFTHREPPVPSGDQVAVYNGNTWLLLDEPPLIPDTDFRITRLAFLDRFTDAEAIAIDLASIGETVQAATVRRYMSKINAATFVDLARDDTIAGVNALVPTLLTSIRATAILTAPILEHERYNG